MSRNRDYLSRKHRSNKQPSNSTNHRHDIFEERQNHHDLQQLENEALPLGAEADDNERRQALVDMIYERHLSREKTGENDSTSSDEEQINEQDYCWFWDESKKSDDVIVQNCGTEAYFHPDYSCGTAAIRGNRQFREGEEHYWEVQMSSAVYGTDMMIGIGASNVNLDRYKSQFCSLIGKDIDSWGISYFGTLHHNGKTKNFCKKFERGATIGCHLDLWKGTLSFYRNGEPLGIAFDGLLGKELYPMISSTAARTKMKLLCSRKTNFSLQYLCCKEISKNIPSSRNNNVLETLPLPNGLKKYIGWRMDWVFTLNNPRKLSSSAPTSSTNSNKMKEIAGPQRKRIRSKHKDKETPLTDEADTI
ncbi:SPRY domain-containing SOCS box protein 3-like [Clytia hemisphaerica]|uniref:SPRY domain-containing SOCS box protein 3 n=1 Tax=Clytia hemisphaerica TaxID=252671 RepID=A0A7M5XIG4_9CNID